MVKTVESPKGLSGQIWPREVPMEIRLSPEAQPLKESLLTQGTSQGQIFQIIPKDFPLFVRLWASKTETVGLDFPKPDSVKSRL